MLKQRVPMRREPGDERRRHFGEVETGYSPEEARIEAERCLQCKNAPCVGGCPVNVDIPGFIRELGRGNLLQAGKIIRETNSLPAVCGRVCPQEHQCEKYCVRARQGESVAIGSLERFVADHSTPCVQTPEVRWDEKVAVIGSGPAGLACAGELTRRGYSPTVFEAFHQPGGVLVYGIPSFRLPRTVVDAEIASLKARGVTFRTSVVAGRTVTHEDLIRRGYAAVFAGTGAGLPLFPGIPGEHLKGVCSANEFLTRVNLMQAWREDHDTPVYTGRSVAVIGGGNVAMDAARCAVRLGAERVSIIYRRDEEDMPARIAEVHHAREEGVDMHFRLAPLALEGSASGWVSSLTCQRTQPEEQEGGRRSFTQTGETLCIPVDMVIIAIGTRPNPLLKEAVPGVRTSEKGTVDVRPVTQETSVEGVFAGGDAVTGAATVIQAMGAGRRAAAAMDRFLASRRGSADGQ